MKALVLTREQWRKIKIEISKSHPRSVLMIRWKMKEVLGFTPREHREWREDYVELVPRTMIHLDFFDEAKRTMFLLKYTDIINAEEENA